MLLTRLVSDLLIDFCFGVSMLAAGFVAGWWLNVKSGTGAIDSERARVALGKLQALASSVAQDVGEHNSRVREISSELNSARQSPAADLDSTVLGSVAEIIRVNEQLQEQLATAEVKLQRQAEELETQTAVARTDALTGLYNRRAFDDEIARRLAEWQRRKSVFSLVMLDVDHFKKFNDKHGHLAGDQVLRDVASALQGTMREMDFVNRYGGEEFAVILPITTLGDAMAAAERVRAAVAASVTEFQGTQLRVTSSLGVAQVLPGDDVPSLVRRADEALYGAKTSGRNRVCFHNGSCWVNAGGHDGGEKPAPAAAMPVQAPPVQTPPVQTPPVQTATERTPTCDSRGLSEFCTDLRRRVLECRKFNVPLSLLLVDLDDFKVITDALGGSARELVFDMLTEFLGMALSERDVVSRYGNGQFAVMMPGTSLASAVGVAQRVGLSIASCKMKIKGSEARITVSLGLAEALPSDDANSFIRRADSALFASKAAGGNCAHQHTGQSCEPCGAVAMAC